MVTTDKLRSYSAAVAGHWASWRATSRDSARANRTEILPQQIGLRERKKQRFTSHGSAQRFVSVHAAV